MRKTKIWNIDKIFFTHDILYKPKKIYKKIKGKSLEEMEV